MQFLTDSKISKAVYNRIVVVFHNSTLRTLHAAFRTAWNCPLKTSLKRLQIYQAVTPWRQHAAKLMALVSSMIFSAFLKGGVVLEKGAGCIFDVMYVMHGGTLAAADECPTGRIPRCPNVNVHIKHGRGNALDALELFVQFVSDSCCFRTI